MNSWLAALLSFIGALLVALSILGLRALWSLADVLATNRAEIKGLRDDTTDNTEAIKQLTRRVDRIDRRPPRVPRG